MHYLDNAATTQVAPAVADEADRVLRQFFANPSSRYTPGLRSEEIVAAARARVAHSLGCDAAQVRFTACGSEGNNLAIFGACRAREKWANHIVVTGYEHPSAQLPCENLGKAGWHVSVVMPDADGHVDARALAEAVTDKTALVCAMHVNNEVGVALDVAALAKAAKEKNSRVAVHVDGVQAWCKRPIRLADTAIDSYAVSAHKIHGPKGVGALYLRRGYHIEPVVFGGGQEMGFRPGTENVAYLAAMAKAVERMEQNPARSHIAALQAQLLEALHGMDCITVNSPTDAVPDIVNFSVDGIKSEPMLHFLEARDIYVSSGSACGRGAASHTLSAMGLPRMRVDTALRVSFSAENTPEDVSALVSALAEGAASLAKMRR